MSGRNAKLLRKFARREREARVIILTRPLARAMRPLAHRDRALVRRRIALGGRPGKDMSVVRLAGGGKFDLARFARAMPSGAR